MVTPTNHVIAGPDLHRAGPLALWRFLQDLFAKYRGRPKKCGGPPSRLSREGPQFPSSLINLLDYLLVFHFIVCYQKEYIKITTIVD